MNARFRFPALVFCAAAVAAASLAAGCGQKGNGAPAANVRAGNASLDPNAPHAEGAESEGEPTRLRQQGAFRFNMTLDPSPVRAGEKTTMTLLVLGKNNAPLVNGSASADLKPAGAPAATLSVPFKQTSPGTLEGRATFPAVGTWEADVTVKDANGRDTGTATYRVPVGSAQP